MYRNLVLFLACMASLNAQAAVTGDAILGLWQTENGKAQIEIYRCQERYCGRIAALKEPVYPVDDERGMAGQSKVDRENPDASLRTRPLLGLELLSGFVYGGGGVWQDGHIYDAEKGKTYQCKLTLEGDKELLVRGFIGFSLIGRTTHWHR